MQFSKTWQLPILILGAMFVLMLGSAVGDSLTMDELAHIPAGYSYVKLFDYRLNPEHPPLVKALAGIPLLFLDLKFPTDTKSWAEDINGQWTQGTIFIFESGNNADQLIFWARLPMMLLTLFLGVLIYWWVLKNFGRKVAALTLALFAFSPTILAHGRLVTTDIGATLGFIIGIITYLRFLELPNWKNALIAGVAFGVAELLKFSTFLLVPMYGMLLIAWILTDLQIGLGERIKKGAMLLGKTVVIGAIGVIVISLVYAVFVMNYPAEKQLSDSTFTLQSFGNRSLVDIQQWMVKNPVTRPFGHYYLGLLMVIQRAAGGNTAYFLGEVSSAGSRLYFPVMYLTKER
ncbi:MAG: glycosyltransferase family 39 protein [Candidatus Sungbacteria bacterium]|uniref:Glycosyltransferase family 39 protein n=1 Tax=Candidatus Sungiibacteriota bacterium TaxID=2750080 RepID=A0A931WP18_9BACT|nr:glycosyltransferase family 39 protein [Candidatus Sungbacteria bacterium]